MKPRFLTSLLLFLSAYAPIALIVAAKDLDTKKWKFEHRDAALGGIALGAAWRKEERALPPTGLHEEFKGRLQEARVADPVARQQDCGNPR